MATISAVRAVHATLSTTTVDTVNLSIRGPELVNVWNRVGTADLTVTYADDGTAATPVALANDTLLVPQGKALTFSVGGSTDGTQFKVLGNGNAYSVQVLG